jgi:hypothetical protein
MRFNWDAVIPAVALMHDDGQVPPIKGTGFEIERGKNHGEYHIRLVMLDQPTEAVEHEAPPAA